MSKPNNDLTFDQVCRVLAYDPETGLLTWKINTGSWNAKIGDIAGCVNKSDGYIQIKINYRMYKAHRLAFLLTNKMWPTEEIDHINTIRTDNRWCNLREANRKNNSHNQLKHINNKSGYKGVCWNKAIGKWKAQIRINFVKINLGHFTTPEAAHSAYCAAATEYHKEFARTE